MAWFSLAKIALQAGSKIYSNRQKTKMAMSDAQLMHAEKMARGEEQYQGKLLEARQNDYKDEFVLVIISAPIIVLMWAVMSDDPAAMEKVKLFFEYFQSLPSWFTNLMDTCSCVDFWYKGYTSIYETEAKNNAENRGLRGLGLLGKKKRPRTISNVLGGQDIVKFGSGIERKQMEKMFKKEKNNEKICRLLNK